MDLNENEIRADPGAESCLHIGSKEYQVIGEEYRATIDNIKADIKRQRTNALETASGNKKGVQK